MPYANEPPRTPTALLAASLALTTALTPGCVSTWFATGNNDQSHAVRPDDFIGEPSPAAPDQPPPTTLVASDVADDAQAADDPGTPNATQGAVSINAMVGHINGEAVYADQIFNPDVEAQLRNYGRRFTDDRFNEQANLVIMERLRGVIMNKLILGEAERNLKDAQRQGIERQVQARREEMLRFYGQGSLAKAKAEFRNEQGAELDDHLATFREELSMYYYRQSKVMPRINVTKLDVEHWYNDNLDRYHRPDSRVFRMIRVDRAEAAEAVQRRLERGEAFAELAADASLNTYNPDGRGVFNSGEPLAGDTVIGIKPVNDALLPLAAGEYAGPILAGDHHYFVQVIEFEPGVRIKLAEAQLEIEKILQNLQFEKEVLRFRRDVWERGSFTDPEEMGLKLLEIANARYNQ